MIFGTYPAEGNKISDISYFYGINRTRRPKKGEFTDMYNMSSCEYPCMSPRGKRVSVVEANGKINAVCAPDSTNVTDISAFTGISEGVFYYNGEKKSGKNVLSEDYDWEIIRKGNLYIINGFKRGETKESYSSQMFYYNIDSDVFDITTTRMDNLILYADKDSYGNFLATIRYGFDAVCEYVAESPDGTTIANQDFFDEYAGGGHILPSDNIFEEIFSVGDEVSISGFPTEDENFGQVWTYNSSKGVVYSQDNQDFSINNTVDTDAYAALAELGDEIITNAYVDSFGMSTQSVDGSQVYIHKIYFKLYNKNGDEIDFEDMNGSLHYYCSGVSIEKRTRRFDNIALHHGRVWGTIPTGNVIYASASDNIFSFSEQDILSKFAARIMSDSPGAFTAICECNDEVVAFKEDSITIIYGSGVSSYNSSVIYGVGCTDKRSVQVTPEGVIFLSYNGFYCYSGGVPVCISQKLNGSYTEAVSGFDGDIYYACVSEGDKKLVLTYDLRYGVWHIYDEIDAVGFFRFRNGFYVADENSIYKTNSDDMEGDWSFTSVKLYDYTFSNKALNEIWIYADVSQGACFKVETSVDAGEFREHSSFNMPGLRIFRCPVRALMGHDFRYRISGTGKVVFYGIELKTAEGGRRYKEYETG